MATKIAGVQSHNGIVVNSLEITVIGDLKDKQWNHRKKRASLGIGDAEISQ